MNTREEGSQIFLHQVNEGLRARSPAIPLVFVRILIARHIQTGGVVFMSGDVGKNTEKVPTAMATLIDFLAKNNKEELVVGFDIPSQLEPHILENASKTREEIKNFFPSITDYKIAALQTCARNNIPTFCFGWDWENERRVFNPWKIGPRSLSAVWKKEQVLLRQKHEYWSGLSRKGILAVVDPWAASDKGIPCEFNEPPKGQGGLFDEPHIPWLNVKIGTSSLAGHQPWLEACFDWIIREE